MLKILEVIKILNIKLQKELVIILFQEYGKMKPLK